MKATAATLPTISPSISPSVQARSSSTITTRTRRTLKPHLSVVVSHHSMEPDRPRRPPNLYLSFSLVSSTADYLCPQSPSDLVRSEVTLEFLGFTTCVVWSNSPLLGWMRLDVDLNKDFSYISGMASFRIPRLICVSSGITRLICVSSGITRLISASSGITKLISAFYGITKLICVSFGTARLIDVCSTEPLDCLCKGNARDKSARSKKNT
ncbi:hypothetical protein E5676_scaffold121G00220 [Cucumis melo var. makuwa]|nr:hypothetical protein E5676_scaffold121G00220 [Cucumis melo var. makuwa]